MEASDKVRIVVVGDAGIHYRDGLAPLPSLPPFVGVGKSSLVHQLCHRSSPSKPPPRTVACHLDVSMHTFSKNGRSYYVEMLEVAGQSKHPATRTAFYQQIHGLILVHDVCNKKSYQNLWKWYDEVVYEVLERRRRRQVHAGFTSPQSSMLPAAPPLQRSGTPPLGAASSGTRGSATGSAGGTPERNRSPFMGMPPPPPRSALGISGITNRSLGGMGGGGTMGGGSAGTGTLDFTLQMTSPEKLAFRLPLLVVGTKRDLLPTATANTVRTSCEIAEEYDGEFVDVTCHRPFSLQPIAPLVSHTNTAETIVQSFYDRVIQQKFFPSISSQASLNR